MQNFLFHYTNKWYKHKLESVPENHIQRILWDFETQTDPLIKVRWTDPVIIKNKICLLYKGLCRFATIQSEKSKKTERETCIWTLPEDVEKRGIWTWWGYELLLACAWNGTQCLRKCWRWEIWKSKDETRAFKVQNLWVQLESREMSWRLEETCSQPDTSERPKANAGENNSKGLNYHDLKIRRKFAREIRKHRTAASTLLSPISSAYRDLHL